MKLLLALALFVGLACCDSSSYHGWEPSKEFVYRYESSTLTGIPEIRNQYSGLKLSSTVRVQTFRDYSLRIQLVSPKFIAVNQLLEERNGRPLVPRPEHEVPEVLRKPLTSPFLAHMKRGIVESLFVEQSEPVLVTNLKKAILAQLQLDLSGSRRGEVQDNSLWRAGSGFGSSSGSGSGSSSGSGYGSGSGYSYGSGYGSGSESSSGSRGTSGVGENMSGVFTVQESTMVGDCQVRYQVHPLPKYQALELESNWDIERKRLVEEGILFPERSEGEQACRGKEYFEVIKTKDLSKCKRTPIFIRSKGRSDMCDLTGNGCKEGFAHISTSRYILCGTPEEYLVRDVKTFNDAKGNLFAYNTKETVALTSQISLFLLKVRSSGFSPLSKPQQPVEKHSMAFEFSRKSVGSDSSSRPTSSGFLPKPDMRSASPLLPPMVSTEELIQNVVDSLKVMVKDIGESPMSCGSKSDVAGSSLIIAQHLRALSYDDLKSLDRAVKSSFSSSTKDKKLAIELFADILASVGTNPSVLLVKHKLMERGDLDLSHSVNVLQATIRNVITPTEEVLKEIHGLIKYVKSNRRLHNVGVVQLSSLVYDACIDPKSSLQQYPVKLFGRFCSKESSFITEDLIPHLTSELEESQSEHMHHLYISALGKLGHKDILPVMMKAIEGKFTKSPMARSLAVYSLKRLAKQEGSLVRPILLALISNSAETTEVRIAAIATLPFSHPSMSELETLAVRTWFEPTKQVASFITTTLKDLSTTESPELKSVREKAKLLKTMMREGQFGIQFSHSSHSNKFVEYLRMAVSNGMTVVTSEKELTPSRVSFSAHFYGGSWKVNGLTLSIYTQGMDHLMDKISTPSEVSEKVRGELEMIKEKLGIISRQSSLSPQILVQAKALGMETFSSIDKQLGKEIIEQAQRELKHPEVSTNGKDYHLTRALTSVETIILSPSDTGFLMLYELVLPQVYSVKGKVAIKSASEGSQEKSEVVADLVPVVNSKLQGSVGVISPFTKEFLATSVMQSWHASSAVSVSLKMNNFNQVTLALKTPKEVDREIEVLHMYVQPMTVRQKLNRVVPISKGSSVKVIESGKTVKEDTIDIGRSLGIKSQLKVHADYKHFDLYTVYNILKQHSLSSLNSLVISPSLRSAGIKLTFNPVESHTKEIKLKISSAGVSKLSSSGESSGISVRSLFGSEERPSSELKKICQEHSQTPFEADQCVERELNDLESISSQSHAICDQIGSQEERAQCKQAVHVCEKALSICQQSGRQSEERCLEKKQECESKRGLVSKLKNMIGEQSELSSAHGLSVDSTLVSETSKQSVQTILLAGSRQHGSKITSVLDAELRTPSHPVYKLRLANSISLPDIPYRWNVESLLRQDVRWKIDSSVEFGNPDKSMKKAKLSVELEKTEGQRTAVEKSPEYKKCKEEEGHGRPLSSVCMEVRHQAASVNRVVMDVQLPEEIQQSKALKMIEDAAELALASQLVGSGSSSANGMEGKTRIELDFPRSEDVVQIKIDTRKGQQYKLKNVRVPYTVRGVFPLSLRNGPSVRLLQKSTRAQTPASCRIDHSLISTFDNKTYHYGINRCEHLLFMDCSSSRPLAVLASGSGNEVSGRSASVEKDLKIILGTSIVKLLKKSSSRQSEIEILVNDQRKEVPRGKILIEKSPETAVVILVIRHNLDGVISVENPSEGMLVFFDGHVVEIVAPQRLHNRACGLCGDLNLEYTADLKTPKQCLMSKPRLFAYSYILNKDDTSKCSGIPSQDKEAYEHDLSKCAKQHDVITPIGSLSGLTAPKFTVRLHVTKMQKHHLCLSKQQVDICQEGTTPVETRPVEASFACLTKYTPRTVELSEKAKQGKRIGEELNQLPTQFSATVHEAVVCKGRE